MSVNKVKKQIEQKKQKIELTEEKYIDIIIEKCNTEIERLKRSLQAIREERRVLYSIKEKLAKEKFIKDKIMKRKKK